MKQNNFFLPLFLCFFLHSSNLFAQKNGLDNNESKKLNQCELTINDRKMPVGYLYQVTADSVSLFYNVQNNAQAKSVFSKQVFLLANVERAKVANKKKQLLFAGLGAIVLGTTSFLLLHEDNSTINIMGEEEKSSFFSGNGKAVLGGIVGAGLGTSLGLVLSNKKIDFKADQEAAVKELKRWAAD